MLSRASASCCYRADAGVDILHACGATRDDTTCRVEFISGEPQRMTKAEKTLWRSAASGRPALLPDRLRSRHDRPRHQPSCGKRPSGSRPDAGAHHTAATRVDLTRAPGFRPRSDPDHDANRSRARSRAFRAPRLDCVRRGGGQRLNQPLGCGGHFLDGTIERRSFARDGRLVPLNFRTN